MDDTKRANANIKKEVDSLNKKRSELFAQVDELDAEIRKMKSFCTHLDNSIDDHGDCVCNTCGTTLTLSERT